MGETERRLLLRGKISLRRKRGIIKTKLEWSHVMRTFGRGNKSSKMICYVYSTDIWVKQSSVVPIFFNLQGTKNNFF